MNPLASLADDRPASTRERPPVAPRPVRPPVDHSASEAIYARYVARAAELAPHREYAKRVVIATAGAGMTPAKPFATMGCGGGPLLCDHCRTPIPLEGGVYNSVPADQAWTRYEGRSDKWVSYIKGGVVVEVASNGTLRIYHGYQGRGNVCCDLAKKATDAADMRHQTKYPDLTALTRFLRHRFPERTDEQRCAVINEVLNTLYLFDPGIGVNRPD